MNPKTGLPDAGDGSPCARIVQRLANDHFTYRNSSKYIEAQPYAFTAPFGAERQSLRVDQLVPVTHPKPKSPIIGRYPGSTSNAFISVTKVDYRSCSFLPVVRSPRYDQQMMATARLSSPNFHNTIASLGRLCETTQRNERTYLSNYGKAMGLLSGSLAHEPNKLYIRERAIMLR
jgi:hypothetical protein